MTILGSTSRGRITYRRRCRCCCVFSPCVYLGATNGIEPRRGSEKQVGKKARFNGRNEFPATWSAIASALFCAPLSSTPPSPLRSFVHLFVGLRWNNTDHVDLSISGYIQPSRPRRSLCAEVYINDGVDVRRTASRKNTRNEGANFICLRNGYSASGDRKRAESATGAKGRG